MKALTLLAGLVVLTATAFAQIAPLTYKLPQDRGSLDDVTPVPRLASNVIIDIRAMPTVARPDSILWLGTGNGVTRLTYSRIAPPPRYGFETYGPDQGLGKGGVSALVVTDSIIWTAFAFDTSVGISGAGGGLAYSRDGGHNWVWFPQPRDRIHNLLPSGFDTRLGYWPTATNVDNITYDIAMSDSFIWTVSKGGGLRRHAYAGDYTDFNNDTTGWTVVSPDTFPFHPLDRLNHRAFSIVYAERTHTERALFVGTASGINKSTDNGRTWRNINSANSGISGNFVTALAYNPKYDELWAATWRAESPTEFYGVSKSTDGGNTWTAYLDSAQVANSIGHSDTPRAHSFAFDSSVVYVCDDLGLWKSPNGGNQWDLQTQFIDNETGHQFFEPQIYAALKYGPLWVGGVDGLAESPDDGRSWQLFQAADPVNDPARPTKTYAYPCPWSPSRFGPVRFQYSTTGGNVKVTVYDFAMSKVVELPSRSRPSGEQYEIWDGKKDGSIVANGTYFYKIEKPGGDEWGKLIVLD